MGLLEMLRPDETRGWDALDEAGQLRLLRQAQRAGHLPTLRMLAELRTLAGEARAQLLAEREPTIRKRTLTRRDLTEQETAALYNSETRASVLAAAADSIPDERLGTLLDIAEKSRGTSLVEALLRRGRLDEAQQLRMLRTLAARKPYHNLTGGIAETVLRKIPPDSGLILWTLSDPSQQRYGLWNIRQLLNRIATQIQHAEQADTLLAALVGAGHTQPAQSLAERLLDTSSVLSANASMPISEVASLYTLLEIRLSNGKDGWAAMRPGVGRLLAQLHPLLPGNQPTVAEPDSVTADSAAALEELSTSEIAGTLVGDRPMDAIGVARLSCNPNHTDETARKLAALVFSTAGASLEMLDRFDQVHDLVWSAVTQTSHGAGTVSAEQALERLGVERLSQTLANPRFRGAVSSNSRGWWRTSWPLLNTSPLAWLLSDGVNPTGDNVSVALALPLQHTIRGDEALAFRLLADLVGDDAALWDVVDGLADQWDGSYLDLLNVARKVNS